ncbi:MAG TPA: hypothetical protein VFC93_07345 [Chloroflexota bacterium]|nr:hypothetical protein [Chloroflexota bacterium]
MRQAIAGSKTATDVGAVLRVVADALAALAFTTVRLREGTEYALATRAGLIGFTAENPYQRRVLVPWLAHQVSQAVQASNTAIFGVFDWLGLVLALILLRRLAVRFVGAGGAGSTAAALLYALAFNDLVLDTHYYPYDLPAVAFWTAFLLVALERRWRLLHPVFWLATLNRETSVFMIPALGLSLYGAIPAWQLALHSITMIAVWAGLQWWLRAAFAGNGGAAFEVHMTDNLAYLATPSNWLPLLLCWGGAWLPAFATWRHQPAPLRRLLMLVPPFAAVFFYGGVVGEIRVLGEVAPIVVLAASAGIAAVRSLPVNSPRTWAAAALVAVGVPGAVLAQTVQHGNALPDPSFEQGLAGWENHGMALFERSAGRAYHGGYALHARTAGLQWAASAPVAVAPGAAYEATAWVHVEAGAVRLAIQTTDGEGLAEAHAYAAPGWHQLVARTPGPVGVGRVLVSLDDYHQPSEFYADLVSLSAR